MRGFLLGLMIVLVTIIVILWVSFFMREQNYLQSVPDYTRFSSAAGVQSYLNQKLEVGKSTEADVDSFIIQSGIAPKISSGSNCNRLQMRFIDIFCQVRAPVTDYSNEPWLRQIIYNLRFEYYFIDFEFEDSKLKQIEVHFFIDRGFAL